MFDLDVLGVGDVDAERTRTTEGTVLSTVALDVPVGELPRGPAVALAPEATLLAAIETMRRRARTAAVVVRQHRPIGVVTDRDIVSHVLAAGEELGRTTLAGVMVPCAVPLRESDTVATTLRRMCKLGRWHLPLVCERGLFLGGIDFTDIAQWLRDRMIVLSVESALNPPHWNG